MAIAELVIWNWSLYREVELLLEANNIDINRVHAVNIDQGALGQVEVCPRPGDILEEGVHLAIVLAQQFTTIYRDAQTGWLFWLLPNDTAEGLRHSLAELYQHPRKQTKEEIADLRWHIRQHELRTPNPLQTPDKSTTALE